MDTLEQYIGCTKQNKNLTKTTLKISQPDLITKMTKGFIDDVKSILTFNFLATPHMEVIHKQ